MSAILTPQEIDGINEYIHHYPQARAAVLDALKLVQKRNGWVDDAQVLAIANMLSIAVSDVEGVATFLTAFTAKKWDGTLFCCAILLRVI